MVTQNLPKSLFLGNHPSRCMTSLMYSPQCVGGGKHSLDNQPWKTIFRKDTFRLTIYLRNIEFYILTEEKNITESICSLRRWKSYSYHIESASTGGRSPPFSRPSYHILKKEDYVHFFPFFYKKNWWEPSFRPHS